MSNALDLATDLLGKAGKPAYVTFHRASVDKFNEDAGRRIPTDVDFVTLRQIGATDSIIFEVDRWFKQNEVEVKSQRLPMEHFQHYKKMYELWQMGQEMPIEGTPIKGWGMISPAQQEVIIRAGVRTVEDLATVNEEGQRKIGMGAVMLKNKAQAWISQLKDKGPATQEIADLKAKNEIHELNIARLKEQLELLQQDLKQKRAVEAVPSHPLNEEDMLEAMTVQPRRGRPRKEA